MKKFRWRFRSEALKARLQIEGEWRIKDLADQGNLSRATVIAILNKDSTYKPSVESIEKLMDVTGLEPNDIFAKEEVDA